MNKVTFKKTDYNRFTMQFKYCKKLVEICKSIPGRQFNTMDNSWSFPINQYNIVTEKIALINNVTIENGLKDDEINDIQVVIFSEEPDLIVSFPKNEEIKLYVKYHEGEWDEEKFCWIIKGENKNLFLDKLRRRQIKTIKFEEPKKKSSKLLNCFAQNKSQNNNCSCSTNQK